MKDLYHKYFYNRLNKVLLLVVMVSLVRILCGGNSIIPFEVFMVCFLPISYYTTFCKNKTIEDIVPISSKEKFKRNFLVWIILIGIYMIICFIKIFNYANGNTYMIHEWVIQQSSVIVMPIILVAGAIARRKYKSDWMTVVGVGITICMLVPASSLIVMLGVEKMFGNEWSQIVADIIRVICMIVAIRYSFKNIDEIKF